MTAVFFSYINGFVYDLLFTLTVSYLISNPGNFIELILKALYHCLLPNPSQGANQKRPFSPSWLVVSTLNGNGSLVFVYGTAVVITLAIFTNSSNNYTVRCTSAPTTGRRCCRWFRLVDSNFLRRVFRHRVPTIYCSTANLFEWVFSQVQKSIEQVAEWVCSVLLLGECWRRVSVPKCAIMIVQLLEENMRSRTVLQVMRSGICVVTEMPVKVWRQISRLDVDRLGNSLDGPIRYWNTEWRSGFSDWNTLRQDSDGQVIGLGSESGFLSGGIFDCFQLSSFVQVAVLSLDIALIVTVLHFERTISRFVTESVRSVIVNVMDLTQNRNRCGGFFLAADTGEYQQRNQSLW